MEEREREKDKKREKEVLNHCLLFVLTFECFRNLLCRGVCLHIKNINILGIFLSNERNALTAKNLLMFHLTRAVVVNRRTSTILQMGRLGNAVGRKLLQGNTKG